MENKEFQALALNTAATHFHGENVTFAGLQYRLSVVIAAANALDDVKKALFYGKKFNYSVIDNPETNPNHPTCSNLLHHIAEVSNGVNSDQAMGIVHAIIGKITEAGELAEALYLHLEDGRGLDLVNIAEEMGDDRWYDALLFDATGLTAEQVQQMNIDKLRKRFPGKFTEQSALNRDLGCERSQLELGMQDAAPKD